MRKPGQSITITGEAVRRALAEKRSLKDLAYDDTRLALLSDFLENPHAEHPTIKPELLPDDYVFNIFIVDELPDIATASKSAMYLVPRDKPEQDNRYWEYIKTEPTKGRYAWERIGGSEADLSQYAKKEDVLLHETELGYILGQPDGPNADKPLVSAKALSKFPDPTVGGMASVLGWNASNN